MTRSKIIGLVSCVPLLAVVMTPWTQAWEGDVPAVPNGVSVVFRGHCLDCHSGASAEGGVRLDTLATLGQDERIALIARVREQVHLDRMPPEDEPRLSGEARREVLTWISTALAGTAADVEFRARMQRPEYGNYVDHEMLFSGEITEDAFSPPRLWRRSPDHFDVAKRTYFGPQKGSGRTVGEVEKLQQPFHAGDAEGIADYAALFYADSATFDTLYRNAAFVVDRTLLLAFIEYDYRSRGKTLDDWKADRAKVLAAQQDEIERYKREGKTTRYISGAHRQLNAKYQLETPQVYRDIVLGDGAPTREQMEAAIQHHFHRTGQHEPTRAELDKYTEFMQSGIEKEGRYFGLRNVLIAILISPRYIYRSELGLGTPVGDGRTMLAPAELAYAISYALTDQKPDEKLLDAARSGRLETREDVKREVVRLLRDENVEKPRILRFFNEFFGYHHAPEVFKDDDRFYRGFTFFKIARRYVEDTDTLVLHILEKDEDVFRELLTTKEYFVAHGGDNAAVRAEVEAHEKLFDYFDDKPWPQYAKNAKQPAQPSEADLKFARSLHPTFKSLNGEGIHGKIKMLAPFEEKGITPFTYSGKRSRDAQFKGLMAYNIDGYDWDFPVEQPFVLDEGRRAGILSHPSWLIAHSLNATTDPVRRGKWVRERLLAGTVPDVPITVDASVPEDPHRTLRERYAVTEAEGCWKCHANMNPLGYAFEMFDDFGRWRDRENMEGLPKDGRNFRTQPVDTTGRLDGTGDESLDGEVVDAIDLIDRLGKSRRVQQSFVRHAFRYWMGRNEMLSDSKTLIAAEKAYVDNGGSFEEMLISLLTSDSFIYRKPLD